MEQEMIERRLEALSRMQEMRQYAAYTYQRAKVDALPSEAWELLAEVDAEYQPMLDSMDADIAAVEAEIKAAVAQHGATVSGSGIMAQFNKGRVTYDSKRLDGMALAFPQINECKKVGEPFVTFKSVKG